MHASTNQGTDVPQSPDAYRPRSTWGKHVLLVAGLVIAAAVGFYFSSRGDSNGSTTPTEEGQVSRQTGSLAEPSFLRFPLSTLDVKDTVEAPNVAADGRGRVYLAWASKTGESERAVFVSRSLDGGRSFGLPAVAGKGGVYKSAAKGNGKTGGFERRATPQLALDDALVHVLWSQGDALGMQLIHVTSTDGALTFAPGQPVHGGRPATPTFIAMTAGPRGEMACSWLSDRGGAQSPFVSLRKTGASAFDPPLPVIAGEEPQGVCPCCPTAVAFAPDGTLLVGFRNIHQGYRDTAICRLKPGASKFEGPFPVIPDTWKFDGCPHDGPSLAMLGNTLHVLWMDARSGPQRCYHGWANMNDMRFDVRELHQGHSGTQGNAKMVADATGTLHAVWEESIGLTPETASADTGHHHAAPKVGSGGGRAIAYGCLPPGQTVFQQIRLLAPKAGAFQSRPALAVLPGGDLIVVWFELDSAGKKLVAGLFPAKPEGVGP